jgi:transposase
MDGSGWRSSRMASSVIGGRYQQCEYLKVTPYSPELNPIEQVWSWLRQHHLANRCFSSYDDIVEACSIAWIVLLAMHYA